MSKIIHYRNKCIGCGICYEMMPEIWRMSRKDGKATLVQAIVKKEIHMIRIDPSWISLAKNVANACPVKIIKVSE